MEIIVGVILYVLIIVAFSRFGKFLKDSDKEIREMKR